MYYWDSSNAGAPSGSPGLVLPPVNAGAPSGSPGLGPPSQAALDPLRSPTGTCKSFRPEGGDLRVSMGGHMIHSDPTRYCKSFRPGGGRLTGIDSDPPPPWRSSVRVTSTPLESCADAHRDLHGGWSQFVLEASYPATEPFTPGRTREPFTQLRGSVNATDQRRARNRLPRGFAFVIIKPSSRQH